MNCTGVCPEGLEPLRAIKKIRLMTKKRSNICKAARCKNGVF